MVPSNVFKVYQDALKTFFIKKNKVTRMELLELNMSIMPSLLSLLLDSLVISYNEAIFF